MNIQSELNSMHSYLMYIKFPYNSVSVIYGHQDLGFHILFMESVKEMLTDEIKSYIKARGFTYYILK